MKNKNGILLFILCFNFQTFILFAQAPDVDWQHSYGGTGEDKAMAAIETLDGGYIVAGSTESVDGDVTDNKVKLNCRVIKLFKDGTTDWKKCIGGETAHQANDIVQTHDGGYVVAGSTMQKGGNYSGDHGNDDYWITKFNAEGIIEWQRTYGGKTDDVAKAIVKTMDGGFMVAGWGGEPGNNITRNMGGNDYWVVKLNKQGGLQWQNSLGGSGIDNASSVTPTMDGGCVVAGYSNSNNLNVKGNHGATDCWIVKVDSGGIINWQKSIGGKGLDYAYSIKPTKDNGFIIAGITESDDEDVKGNHGNADAWVIKTDSSGNVEWEKCFGGKNNDAAYCVRQTRDGGYVIAGSTNSIDGDVKGNKGGMDVWIVKLDEKGNMMWQKCIGGSADEQAKTIEQTSDGGYIISAYSKSNVRGNTNYDYLVIKLKP